MQAQEVHKLSEEAKYTTLQSSQKCIDYQWHIKYMHIPTRVAKESSINGRKMKNQTMVIEFPRSGDQPISIRGHPIG